MGTQYRGVFTVASLASLTTTTLMAVYGTRASKKGRFDFITTAWLSLLAVVTGLFLFVIP